MRPTRDFILGVLTASVRHPWWTLLLSGAIAALAVQQAAQLRPIASLRNVMPGDDAAARAMNRIIEDFSITDELLLLVAWPENRAGEATEIEAALIQFAERLASAIRSDERTDKLCGAIRFRAPPDFRLFLTEVMVPGAWHYADDATRQALRQRLTPQAMRAEIRRCAESLAAGGGGGVMAKTLAQDVLGLHNILGPMFSARLSFLAGAFPTESMQSGDDALLTPDRRALLMRIGGMRPVSDLDYARGFPLAIREKANDVNSDKLDLEFAGAYPIAEFAERSIRADMIRSIVVALVLLQILFWFAFRDLRSFPMAIVPVGSGCVLGFAVYAQIAGELTPMTAAIGAVLAGLGVDYAIHVLSHYRHARRDGMSADAAVRQMLATVGPAMVTACGTSVLGLLVVARSQVPALREFALLGALGLAGSLVMTVLVLPALLSIVEGKGSPGFPYSNAVGQMRSGPGEDSNHSRNVWSALASWSIAALIAGCFAIAVLRGWPEFEDDLTVLHPRPNPALAAQAYLTELFGNVADPLLVHLRADSAKDLVSLAYDAQARLRRAAAAEADIAGMHSLAVWLPDTRNGWDNSPFMDEAQVAALLVDFDAAIQESVFAPEALRDYREFLRKLVSSSAPPTLSDLATFPEMQQTLLPRNRPTNDQSDYESIMTLFVKHPMTNRMDRERVVRATSEALHGLPGAVLTGTAVMGHGAELAIRREVARVVEPSTLFVLAWVVIYFRRVGASLLAVLPAVSGFAVMMAVMHLMGWKLNLINLLGVAIFAGIGVDNGVLLVSLARKRNAEGEAMTAHPGAWRAALSAMSLTTLSTVLSFAALCFTSTPGIQSLGATVTVGMIGAWVASVGLLAPLLRRKEEGVNP